MTLDYNRLKLQSIKENTTGMASSFKKAKISDDQDAPCLNIMHAQPAIRVKGILNYRSVELVKDNQNTRLNG